MRSDGGQSLMELVVVIAVIIIVIGALVFATIASLRNAAFSQNQAQATKLAQEGLEWVRTGRDRNVCIRGLIDSVKSWNGNSSDNSCSGNGGIWEYSIFGDCERNQGDIVGKCYFNISSNGALQNIGFQKADFPESSAEVIAGGFKRAIILSDDEASSETVKKVTAIVKWVDFSGSHESKLTTILRKI